MTLEVLSCWSSLDLWLLNMGFAVAGMVCGVLIGWGIWSQEEEL